MLQVMPISGPGWQLPLCMGWQSGIYLAVLLPWGPPPPFFSSLVQQMSKLERAPEMASLVCAFWVGHLLTQRQAELRGRCVSPAYNTVI